jgi:RNA recognition motif-containing protein
VQGKTLFVSRVSENIEKSDLFQEFSYFGWVRSLRIIRGKGIAFVEMSTTKEAENAILGLDGIEINGYTIRVKPARPRNSR